MPIKGMTSSEDYNPRRAIPFLGHVRKGEPKPESGNRPGKDLDYFRIDFESNFTWLLDEFTAIYGDKPKELKNVVVMGDKPDMVFDTWYRQYNSKHDLVRQCDGDNQVRYLTDEFNYSTKPKACIKNAEKPCDCKQTGILYFGLPLLVARTGVNGFFIMTTHGVNDILNIYNTLQMVYKNTLTLRGLTFDLSRVPQEINHAKQERQADGSYTVTGRLKTTKALVYLNPTQQTTIQYMLPAMTSPVMLELPESTDTFDEDNYILESGDDSERPNSNSELTELSEKFFAWSLDNLNLQAIEVFDAIRHKYSITELDNNTHETDASQNEALACVISYYAGYDIGMVLDWFNAGNLTSQRADLFPLCESLCKKDSVHER